MKYFIALISFLAATVAAAETPNSIQTQAVDFWRAATRADVEAAYTLIKENHPGALPEIGDTAFRAALETAHAAALTRAADVTSFEGYTATLAAFGVALGDKHIGSRPLYNSTRVEWSGLVTAKRADHWIVVDEEATPTAPSVKGAQLISCDGRAAEDLARASLGVFKVDWSVGAQQIQAAPWLLVDEHNPFIARPKTCLFDKAGQQLSVTLAWRPAARATLTRRIIAAIGAGSAGFGVRAVGDGWWIALQSLTDPAAPVVADVVAKADTLRKAKFVVLDMRGNGGGSSTFGDQIARALLGDDYVSRALGPVNSDCGDVWRVSEGNIRQLEYYVDTLASTRGAEFKREMAEQLARAKKAQAAGRPLSGSVSCHAKAARSSARPRSKFDGRLILITDNVCFSSCLEVTQEFRTLGALHVGQTTDANTHYTENRDEALPSGLSRFTTQQAISPAAPLRYGPFVPAVAYDGDIADTASLERWVVALH